jgi:uncharacterized membrane protein
MGGRLRLADHDVRSLLLMFPLGLFVIATILDVAYVLGGLSILGTLAYWHVTAGLVGGAPAACAGGFDLMVVRHARGARFGALGVLVDLNVLTVFAVVALIRLRTHDRTADPGLLVVEVLALVMAGVNAWFSGRLDGTDRWGRTRRERTPIG